MNSQVPTASLKPISSGGQADDLLWRISVETYHQMIDAGAFGENEAIELIHGYLVKKMPKNRRHARITQIFFSLIAQLIGYNNGWFLSVQDPITLLDSEPEPDIAIIRGNPADYADHPQATDCGCVIEIADSSLEYDSGVKKQMYALNGVEQYWIVNLDAQQVEIYTNPFSTENEAGYKQQAIYLPSDSLSLILHDVHMGEIDIKLIFG